MFRENRILIVALLSSILFHSAFFLIPTGRQTRKTLSFRVDVFFEEKATGVQEKITDFDHKKSGPKKLEVRKQVEKDLDKIGENTEKNEKHVIESENIIPFSVKEYELREEHAILVSQVKKEDLNNQDGIPRGASEDPVEGKKSGQIPGRGQNESGFHSTPETVAKDIPLIKPLNEKSGPSIKKLVTPKYPETARKLGKEGVVLLRVLIDKDGRPKNVEVIKSAGYGFDEEAKRAIMESIFIPLLENGVPRSCLVDIPVNFVLKKE